MVKIDRHLFSWIMGGWIGWDIGDGKENSSVRKNVSAASYIATFVYSTKGLQWIGATRRRYIGAENLGSHRCGNYLFSFPSRIANMSSASRRSSAGIFSIIANCLAN